MCAPDQLTPHFNRQEFVCCCEGRYCDGFPAEMNILESGTPSLFDIEVLWHD